MKKKNHKVIAICITICLLTLACMIGFFAYVNDYYHADTEAMKALEDDENVDVTIEEDRIIFEPVDDYDTGIIFYPGGKVETEAYALLCKEYAENGIYVVLVDMPFRLAILDVDKADDVIDDSVEHWYMAGHSLGGVCAGTYAYAHTDEIDGVILLASYSTKDLSDTDLKVISLYGSKDQVLNLDSYAENKKNLPEDTTEEILIGGNHSQFGNYGLQEGDGEASISDEVQKEETVQYTLMWLDA